MSQIGPSIIRTVVPLLVQLVVAQLAKRGVDPGPYQELIAQVIGAAVAAGYYGAVRLLETYVKPRLGWLLGSAKAPTYDAPAAPSASSPTGYEATEAATVPEGQPVVVEEYEGRHAAETEGMGSDAQPLIARHFADEPKGQKPSSKPGDVSQPNPYWDGI